MLMFQSVVVIISFFLFFDIQNVSVIWCSFALKICPQSKNYKVYFEKSSISVPSTLFSLISVDNPLKMVSAYPSHCFFLKGKRSKSVLVFVFPQLFTKRVVFCGILI